MTINITEVNDNNYMDIINSNDIVLLDFYSDTCRPCKKMLPIIEKLADEFQDAVAVCKANATGDCSETTRKLDVNGVPCILIYVSGESTQRLVGLHSYNQLKAILDTVLEVKQQILIKSKWER